MRRVLVAVSLCLAACESGSPPTQAAAPVTAAPKAVDSAPVEARVDVADLDAGAAAVADAESPAPPVKEVDRPVLGPFEKWVADYMAASAPETFRPPRLRLLADARPALRSTLVFQRSAHLHRLDLPEGTETQLTSGNGREGAPVWTEDGAQLFFLSNRDDARDRVYRLPAAGGTPKVVTRALRRGSGFSWTVSRDGSQVAYVNGTEPDGVHLVDVASGEDRTIPMAEIQYVSFSRDAATLFVVTGQISGDAGLSSVDVRTGGTVSLRVPKVNEIGQPWDLGDGRLLLVTSADFSMMGRDPHFVTVSTGGGAFSRIGRYDVPIGYLNGEVSPNRARIAGAWSQRQGGLGAAWFEDVTILDLITGAVVAPRLSAMFPRPFYQANDPSWAPDSRHLALTLSVCARADCKPLVRSVVLVDAEHPDETPVFLAEGGAAVFRPEARDLEANRGQATGDGQRAMPDLL
jgi:hypothetical protein